MKKRIFLISLAVISIINLCILNVKTNRPVIQNTVLENIEAFASGELGSSYCLNPGSTKCSGTPGTYSYWITR